MASVVHYDLSHHRSVRDVAARVELAGGIAVVKNRFNLSIGGSDLYCRPQITHVYLSGTLEIAISDDGARLLRVNREHASWLFEKPSTISSVEVLELNGTDVNERDCMIIAKLPKLRTLELAGTGADGRCIQQLARSRSIQNLDLSFTRIDDKDLAAITAIQSLKELTVEGCDIDAKAIQEMKRENGAVAIRIHRQ